MLTYPKSGCYWMPPKPNDSADQSAAKGSKAADRHGSSDDLDLGAIARLAGLDLLAEERDVLIDDVRQIVAHIDELRRIAGQARSEPDRQSGRTESTGDTAPGLLRPDEACAPGAVTPALAAAPQRRGDHFVAPSPALPSPTLPSPATTDLPRAGGKRHE